MTGQARRPGHGIGHVFFLTSKWPFPADDGQKIPIAKYHAEALSAGLTSQVIVAEKDPAARRGLRSRLLEVATRLSPFHGFYARERLSRDAADVIATTPGAAVFVSPARLLGIARRLKERNPDLVIVLLLNDAKWPMYKEALLYGLGMRQGGSREDLIKGLLLPFTFLKELTAYRAADCILVQTGRERRRLPWLSHRIEVATNAIEAPACRWQGAGSTSFAMHVNLTGRRAKRYAPFIRQVWPRVLERAGNLKLQLFGSAGETLPDWVTAAPQVEYLGWVEDLDAFLSDKRGLIMPLDHETGISNTILRGLALDMPMVISETSSRGIAGIREQNGAVFVARSANDYLEHVLAAARLEHHSRPQAIGSWTDNLDRVLKRAG